MLDRAQHLNLSLIGSLSLNNLISVLGLAGEEEPVRQRTPAPGEIWYRTTELELMLGAAQISKVKIYEVKPNTKGTMWVQYGFESTLEKDGFLDSPFRRSHCRIFSATIYRKNSTSTCLIRNPTRICVQSRFGVMQVAHPLSTNFYTSSTPQTVDSGEFSRR